MGKVLLCTKPNVHWLLNLIAREVLSHHLPQGLQKQDYYIQTLQSFVAAGIGGIAMSRVWSDWVGILHNSPPKPVINSRNFPVIHQPQIEPSPDINLPAHHNCANQLKMEDKEIVFYIYISRVRIENDSISYTCDMCRNSCHKLYNAQLIVMQSHIQ